MKSIIEDVSHTLDSEFYGAFDDPNIDFLKDEIVKKNIDIMIREIYSLIEETSSDN